MRIAVVCASGIGDALITSMISHHLARQGHEVTTFSPHLAGFGRWLEPGSYIPFAEDWAQALASFDAAVVQHDNTPRARDVILLRKQGLAVYSLYTNYRPSKHGSLLNGFDVAFDETINMVDNTRKAVEALFGGICSLANSLSPPHDLIHRRYRNRIAIHPTSASPGKNWLPSRYRRLAERLADEGFEPAFIAAETEQAEWGAHRLPTLEHLASFLYESGGFVGNDSGPAHLASYCRIPHIVLRQNRGKRLWQTGWHRGEAMCPPEIKWLENFWKYFISTRRVIKKLKLMRS